MTRMTSRLTGATLICLALLGALVVPSTTGGAVPAQSVDAGITGPVDVAAWAGALTPATMIAPTSETIVFLGFRTDQTAIADVARAVSDPSSSEYGNYRSVAENAATFNATDAEIASVVGWFADRNVTVEVDPTRTFATGSVPITVLEEMTGETYGAYTVAGAPSNIDVVTPTASVTTLVSPLADSVDRVHGLTFLWDTNTNGPAAVDEPVSDVSQFQPQTATYVAADGGTPWRTGTITEACPVAESYVQNGLVAGLSAAQLRTAYGIDRLWDEGFTGAGARIAVVDNATYLPSDITDWRNCFGLDGTPITDHLIGSPPFDPAISIETTLDLQTIISIAPDAERIDWFGVELTAPTSLGSYLQMLAPPLDASLTGGVATDVITLSFGSCEATMEQFDAGLRPGLSIFEQMMATATASGIGTFVSTGDTGSTGCFPNDGTQSTDYQISAQFPATSAWVTAVGGLNLTLDSSNHVESSGVWNDSHFQVPAPLRNDPVGSGSGGLSTMIDRQPWQPVIGDGTHRPAPDVAAYADGLPGYFLIFDGRLFTVGGTSAATPLTATAWALQSTARVANGGPRLGLAAPLLHALSAGVDSTSSLLPVIQDVTLGDNDAHEVGVYDAVPGYDMASGLGWIRHDVLHDLLNPSPDPIGPSFTG